MKRKSIFSLLIVSLVSLVLVLSGCDFLEDAKDKLDDAKKNLGSGVRAVVKDSSGNPVKDTKITVVGFATLDDLTAIKDAFDPKTKKIDLDILREKAKTIKDDTTDGEGECYIDMLSPAFIVFAEKDGYKSAFDGIPQDKKMATLVKDLGDAIKDAFPNITSVDVPDWAVPVDLKEKTKCTLALSGGTTPVAPDNTAPAPAQVEPAATPAPAAVATSSFNVAETPTPQKAITGATDPEKEYYAFSFAWVGASSGSAYGDYDRSQCGQPVPVNTNLAYKWSGGWVADTGTSAPVKRKADGSNETGAIGDRMLVLTGVIPAYTSEAKYMVFEVRTPTEPAFSRHYHYIGFDENGIYETRTIYLAEGWITRLSMCESIADDGSPVGQSYTVTFDDSANAATIAPFIAVMSYDKGFAVEASKTEMDYNYVIDLDYAVTNLTNSNVTAWYDSDNDDALLTYDTWFGYGPEMIIAKNGSDWSGGFTLYTEPYSIGSSWGAAAGIKVNISIDTISDCHKDFTTTFDANGEFYTAGSFKLDGSAVAK